MCSQCDTKSKDKTTPVPWEAIYRDINGHPYWVECSSEQCPKLVITPLSLHYIQLDRRQRTAKIATGAFLYGPDLSKWPSKIVDALNTIAEEDTAEHNARIESERSRNQ